ISASSGGHSSRYWCQQDRHWCDLEDLPGTVKRNGNDWGGARRPYLFFKAFASRFVRAGISEISPVKYWNTPNSFRPPPLLYNPQESPKVYITFCREHCAARGLRGFSFRGFDLDLVPLRRFCRPPGGLSWTRERCGSMSPRSARRSVMPARESGMSP